VNTGYSLIGLANCFVPLLFCPVSSISERSGSFPESFSITGYSPSVDLIYKIFRPTFRTSWLSYIASVYLKGFTIIGRRNRVSIVIIY
jgi:hypothetical protein